MSDSGSGGVGEWAPDRVEAGPVGSRFGEVRWFAEIDSTNRYLLDVARRAPVAGLVAVADHQRAGKGRLGRQWEAPAGTGLLVSVLLLPALPVELLHLCSISVALAAADACRRVGGVTPSLKWPNDLVVGNRKLGGILAESVPSTAGSGRAVVVGVGLNVSWPPGETGAGDAAAAVPEDLRRHATSILRETGAGIDRHVLLSELLEGLDRLLDAVEGEEGRRKIVEDYRRRCATIGRRVRVELADGAIGGTATEVDAAGRLVVVDGATIHVVDAGDVIHLHGGPERGS
ncbi:MAG: biotin--[acetyl-CoA-carboxylase] ligase [Acidobacteriota bacterium]|nr:biotin--[acetyl-CoA-carboxylase] ligase [Acidobacteriota bacterium]